LCDVRKRERNGREQVFIIIVPKFKLESEECLQQTIKLHRDALATLRKDLSLDDADTLAYHQNKLKQAQIDLLKSQTKKKQDKLLANVCDHGDAGVTPGQNLGSMWNYLRKYKNNHAKNSLPPETRSTHLLMPASGKADLLPSTPLTGTDIDSPWVTTSSNTNFPHMTRKKRH